MVAFNYEFMVVEGDRNLKQTRRPLNVAYHDANAALNLHKVIGR